MAKIIDCRNCGARVELREPEPRVTLTDAEMNAHLVPQPVPAPNVGAPVKESREDAKQITKRDATPPSEVSLAEVNLVIAKLKRVDGPLLVKELAAMLRVNKATVYRWTTRQHNPLPHVRIGGVVRLDGTWTADWLQRQLFR